MHVGGGDALEVRLRVPYKRVGGPAVSSMCWAAQVLEVFGALTQDVLVNVSQLAIFGLNFEDGTVVTVRWLAWM